MSLAIFFHQVLEFRIAFTYSFPNDSAIKNLPTVQETQEMEVRSLGQEDPLEEEMATRSSIAAGEPHFQDLTECLNTNQY